MIEDNLEKAINLLESTYQELKNHTLVLKKV